MEVPFKLILIGKPRLQVNGKLLEIRPRAVFELLAVIVAAGEKGISRAVVAEKMWSHLDKNNARLQLRIAAHKLREELRTLGLFDLFDLESKHLAYHGPAAIDIMMIASEPRAFTFYEVEQMVQPIADGWNTEHWLAERDSFGEFLSTAVERLSRSRTSSPKLTSLMQKAVRYYPTTTRLYLQLGEILKQQGREAEFVEMVIAFEDRWIERFGSADIPDFMQSFQEYLREEKVPGDEIAEVESQTESPPATRSEVVAASRTRKFNSVPFIVVAAALTVAATLVIILKQPPVAQAQSRGEGGNWPTAKQVSQWDFVAHGKKYRVTHLKLAHADIKSFHVTNNGALLLTENQGELTHQAWIHSNGTIEWVPQRDGLRLVDENVSVSDPLPSGFTYQSSAWQQTFTGTAELPDCGFQWAINPTTILFWRSSGTPEQDTVHPYLATSHGERQIDSGWPNAKIAVPTYLDNQEVFFLVTGGKSDRFRYRTVRYSLETGQATVIPISNVIGKLSDGTLVGMPEKTIYDGNECEATSDGSVELYHPTGKTEFVHLSGLPRFDEARALCDLLLLGTRRSDRYIKTTLYDTIAKTCIETRIPTKCIDILSDENGSACLLRGFAKSRSSDDYYLIQHLAS